MLQDIVQPYRAKCQGGKYINDISWSYRNNGVKFYE